MEDNTILRKKDARQKHRENFGRRRAIQIGNTCRRMLHLESAAGDAARQIRVFLPAKPAYNAERGGERPRARLEEERTHKVRRTPPKKVEPDNWGAVTRKRCRREAEEIRERRDWRPGSDCNRQFISLRYMMRFPG